MVECASDVHRPNRAAAANAKRKIHETYVGGREDYDTPSEVEPGIGAQFQRHASGRVAAARPHKRRKTTLLPHAAAANHGEPLNVDLQRKRATTAHEVGASQSWTKIGCHVPALLGSIS